LDALSPSGSPSPIGTKEATGVSLRPDSQRGPLLEGGIVGHGLYLGIISPGLEKLLTLPGHPWADLFLPEMGGESDSLDGRDLALME